MPTADPSDSDSPSKSTQKPAKPAPTTDDDDDDDESSDPPTSGDTADGAGGDAPGGASGNKAGILGVVVGLAAFAL